MSGLTYQVPDLAEGEVFRVEQTIKKSRFIASVGHTPTVESAKAFIEKIKAEFSDARHNCWAYCAGPAGSTAQIGASDDGEPHGTAGRPMLTVLTHSDVGEITVVVTRYFGGILLGTGGLVKAYQSSVKMALEGLKTTEAMDTKEVSIEIDHRFVTPFLRLLPELRASVKEQNFDMKANFILSLPETKIEELENKVRQMTSGAYRMKKIEKP